MTPPHEDSREAIPRRFAAHVAVRVIGEALLEHFADDARITGWISLAMERVPNQRG